jgi:hypothetical protein
MEIPDLEGRADPVVFAKLGSVEDFYYYYYYYLNYIQRVSFAKMKYISQMSEKVRTTTSKHRKDKKKAKLLEKYMHPNCRE